jgi:holo-[acyl-carrier protein] synthase
MSRSTEARALAERIGAATRELGTIERVGVDAVHIPTWERHLRLGGEPLLRRTYRCSEIKFSSGRVERLSSRLAGKEAVLKVLGTGIRGVGLNEVEIVSTAWGQPTVVLHGPARSAAHQAGLTRIEVSLCHEKEYALAVAAGIGETPQ